MEFGFGFHDFVHIFDTSYFRLYIKLSVFTKLLFPLRNSKENNYLRRQTLQLQSELFGSRLAAKYLDKELAGRIQQLQLLGRDVKDADHERLWSQLEAEIHLHRHKTVIRACRASCQSPRPLPAPLEPSNGEMRRRQGVGNVRFVTVDKDGAEGLGISITVNEID